ncbi:MAG: protein-L-isoaspartate O-methyltransferase [Gammaproteobacteria bacterium]|nr:protein-L-isoaspartate O-methyltransferase [Gammaproteobacteria bacterium]MBU1446689.1 protein-L-isoaspartate O-methyltransferase [Gammaproteobacteria bacterium]MDD5471682.1 protein-L-isoaspartate O-methyltransferase [Sideroxydans sp.]
MNLEQARFNMIEQQIRPWDVLDPRVLELLKAVRREQFVPAESKGLAFADTEIPLGHGASMWQPKVEARAVQALSLQPTDNVLEIGTGSGYVTALLARLAAQVTSVEIEPELSTSASRHLATHNIDNVTLQVGDAAHSWGEAEYDAIVLTASVPMVPEAYKQQLKVGGRLFAIVGDAPAMHAQLITRTGADTFDTKVLFETVVAPLRNVQQPERFVF